VRVLCGQCGHVNRLDEDYAEPTVACANCGCVISVPGLPDAPAEDLPAEPAGGGQEPEELGFAEQARQAGGRSLTVTCTHCGKTVTVSARVAGKKARCKNCDHPLEIPYPDDLEDFELPQLYRGPDAHENGLELVPPAADLPELHAPSDSIAEAGAEFDLMAEPELALMAAAAAREEAAARAGDPTASLASYDPAAPLAALDREYEPEESAPPPPEGADELVSAVQDFHGGKPAAARARRRQAGGSRAVQWLLLLAIGGAAIALPLAVVIPILTMDEPKEDDLAAVINNDRPGPAPATRGTGGAAVTPDTRASTQTRPSPKPAPGPKSPACKILAAEPGAFGTGGYFPAPPRSVYWRLKARISAGAEPLRLKTYGQSVRLVFDSERFNSLGVPAAGLEGLFPVRARQATVALKPGESQEVTFLFEVPMDLTKGGLFVRSMPYQDILLPAPRPPGPEVLSGTWQEVAPRSLKPVLRHPVMAAVQAAPDQRLMVSASPEGIDVAIPVAAVAGVGKPVGPGLYETALRHGNDVLEGAVLRFVEGGHRAILYLAEGPFHQLTYVNPKIEAPATRPVLVEPVKPARQPVKRPVTVIAPMGPGIHKVPDHEDPPDFDPNAKPRERDPTKLPTGPSIFD